MVPGAACWRPIPGVGFAAVAVCGMAAGGSDRGFLGPARSNGPENFGHTLCAGQIPGGEAPEGPDLVLFPGWIAIHLLRQQGRHDRASTSELALRVEEQGSRPAGQHVLDGSGQSRSVRPRSPRP